MKLKSILIHSTIALVSVIILLINRGFFIATDAATRVLAAADSFTAVALLFVCFGILIWIASTGVFDMLGFAFKKGAHALIPGRFKYDAENFYEYKMELKEKKKNSAYGPILLVGFVTLVIAIILVLAWYKVSGNL